ncbi:PTI1-like tyrosine-protein kinase, partial [Musa troglodytarum]
MSLFSFCCGRASWGERRRKVSTSWRIFSLKELSSATNNFNYDNKLGEGRFGSVYWGQLWDGSQIAIKRLKVWSHQAEQEFAVEIEVLGRVRHKNLLSLRGYCAEGKEHLIVYDYMPNLSLHSHLHGHYSAECLLDWGRRMSAAIGSAEGIAPEKRPTVLEVVDMLKGASKEKLSKLENDDMFRPEPPEASQGASTPDKGSE